MLLKTSQKYLTVFAKGAGVLGTPTLDISDFSGLFQSVGKSTWTMPISPIYN